MQTDETSGDHIINGFVLPATRIVGEAMNNKFAHQLTSRVSSPNDDFYGVIQSGNAAITFSSSPPMSTFHGNDQYMEGIPLLNASIEIQEKLAIPAPLGSPLENTKYGLAMNSLDVFSSSLEMMLHGYGGLPLPPELVERAVGRASLPTALPARSCYSRGWPMMEQVGLSSTSQDSSQLSNELTLSLVTSRPSTLNGHSIHEQCSELSSNRVATTYSLHDQQILPEHTSCSSSSSKISGSRFVEAMQEILAEFACYALENIQDIGVNASLSSTSIEGDHTVMLQKQEMSLEAKKKHLLTLLQMVDDQYSQCLDAIHTVTSAFHAVTELEPNLHACFALPTISFMYKSLRERISSHILAIGAHQKEGETRENKSFDVCFIQKQWALQQQQQLSKRDHHQLWRPQRGLPETSVSVLRTWMFKNFLHPYPKDSEKHLLALKSGLTRNQVSNWFINARVRLWKPMIEEMCAEMNRRKARKEDDEMEGNHRNQMRFETRSFTGD